MKRFYDAMFAFTSAACVTVILVGTAWHMQKLADAGLWFALAAAAFYVSAKWGTR